VAVDLTHKKEHVAKDIVDSFLTHYDNRGDAFTTLWPFRVDFYHQMGFGLGSTMHRYRVKPASLPRGDSKEHVRYLTAADVPALNDCYNHCFESQNGMIKHNEGRWQNRFEFAENLRFVGCEIDGKIQGYLVYRFRKPDHPASFMDNEMIITEFFYHTPQVLSELLTFLHSQLDQVGRIIFETPEDEFYFLMSDPTLGSGTEIAPTYHESHTSGVGIMYRVMDSRRLFDRLTKPVFGDGNLVMKITLNDSFFPKNNGSQIVRFQSGLGVAVDGGSADVEINLDVAEFSSMIMGAVGFRKLHTYGLARISDEKHLDAVNSSIPDTDVDRCSDVPTCRDEKPDSRAGV